MYLSFPESSWFSLVCSIWLSRCKIIYYVLFSWMYGFVGSFTNLAMVNSSWTREHILKLWGVPGRTKCVYPPCDTSGLQVCAILCSIIISKCSITMSRLGLVHGPVEMFHLLSFPLIIALLWQLYIYLNKFCLNRHFPLKELLKLQYSYRLHNFVRRR